MTSIEEQVKQMREYKDYLESIQNETQIALNALADTVALADTLHLEKKNLLNDEEDVIFRALINGDDGLFHNSGLAVYCQVSCSAFLNSFNANNSDAVKLKSWFIYNKLYVDFLIVNMQSKEPICVIEYSGDGHEKSLDQQARDKIKKFVCHKAEIDFIALESIKDKVVELNNEERRNKKYQYSVTEDLKSYIKTQMIKQSLYNDWTFHSQE